MKTAERWQLAKKILLHALDHDPAERPAFLDEACGEDEGLRKEVESLLAVHERAKEAGLLEQIRTLDLAPRKAFAALAQVLGETLPFDSPGEFDTIHWSPDPAAGLQIPAGQTFGNYELVEELGRGGMGVVYKARQKGLNRLAAIKMILAGSFSSKQAIERFHVEAEAAAQLDHPGIAAVYEVGEEAGRHFYSMAYVTGQSLSDRLAEAEGPLAPREATRLVKQIAEAVHYAHGKGVIHRDLKPSNVLLDEDGSPRVVDFGLAKQIALDSGLTVTGQVMGTPSYMPPEQAAGKAHLVGPAADIYALGAILYSLLTGRPPFGAANAYETIRQVIDNDPVPARLLNSNVPRDLETICQKCLEKDPAKRYPTAQHLADELERFLEGKPIQARPVSWLERAGRWAMRNRVVATLILILAIGSPTAAVFFGILSYQKTQALAAEDQSFRRRLRAVNDLFTRVSEDTLLNQPGAQGIRRDLLEKALAYYQEALTQRGDDRSLRDTVANIHHRVGNIRHEIEGAQTALESYQLSQRILNRLLEEESANVDLDYLLLAYSFDDDREQMWRRLAARVDGEQLERAMRRYAVSSVEADIASLMSEDLRDLPPALPIAESAVAHRRELVKLDESEPEFQRKLANSYMNLGLIQRQLARDKLARQHMLDAQEIRRKLLGQFPDDFNLHRDFGIGFYNLSKLGNLTFDEAIAYVRLALDGLTEAEQIDGQDLYLRWLFGIYCRALAEYYSAQLDELPLNETEWAERYKQCAATYEIALTRFDALVQENPSVLSYRRELARTLIGKAILAADTNTDLESTLAEFQRAEAELVELRNRNAGGVELDYAETLYYLGWLHGEMANARQAVAYLAQAEQQFLKLPSDSAHQWQHRLADIKQWLPELRAARNAASESPPAASSTDAN